jgi:putative GTP pyrophosphokinase
VGETSRTQIDRLGDRLKRGEVEEADLRLLDEYRRSFSAMHDAVVGALRERLALQPTGRSAKSTQAIVEKLRRESIRLSQIQDIAGCRVVVSDVIEQDTVVRSVRALFDDTAVVDRRDKPSHGYRAVHVIVRVGERAVEIQVRSLLQHMWAEVSEKFADVIDPGLKYGASDDASASEFLSVMANLVAMEEDGEKIRAETRAGLRSDDALAFEPASFRAAIITLLENAASNVSSREPRGVA